VEGHLLTHDLAAVELRMVRDTEDAEEFLRWLGERRPGILAIDTETTGLDWWTSHFTRLVQFGDAEVGWTVSVRDWRGLIKIALDRWIAGGQPVGMWNDKFDQHALETEGLPTIPWHSVHDGLRLHHIENPARAHGLKPSSVAEWGEGVGYGEKLLKAGFREHGWNWATVPEEFPPYGIYAALDTVLTARQIDRILPAITARGMRSAYEVEMASAAILYGSERRGLRIDPAYTLALRDAWTAEIEQLRASLRLLGIDNPSSSRQVATALKYGGWDPEEFTEGGQPKTGEAVLRGVMAELGVNAEIATMIVRYRRLVKWSKAYLDRFLSKADDTWHVHPSINTMGARTGRMSVTGPPLQTLPRGPEIRHCILPEEGETLFKIDYDSQELRVFAHFSNEPAMIQAFKEGMDPHKLTASMVYGVPQEEVVKSQRDTAKNTRYARLYGAGPAKIAETASASTVMSGGQPVTEAEIKAFIVKLEAEFPGEAEFVKHLDLIGRQRLADDGVPYVWTYGGRYMPADPDKVYSLLNYLIQGSCADILKRKIIDLDAAGYGDWIMVPVHDELLFSVPYGEEGEMPKILTMMEEREAFKAPLTCEMSGPYSSWGWSYV